jgi:hypothetical protein
VICDSRVPIIKMRTSFGFETDIAVGGHNGCDTSYFASRQSKRFVRYVHTVLSGAASASAWICFDFSIAACSLYIVHRWYAYICVNLRA